MHHLSGTLTCKPTSKPWSRSNDVQQDMSSTTSQREPQDVSQRCLTTSNGSHCLEVRRHDRLSMLYRMQHNLVDIPANRYLSPSDSRTRGTIKFYQERISDTNYSNSFFPRTAKEWNKLPSRVVSAASLEEFRSSLRA